MVTIKDKVLNKIKVLFVCIHNSARSQMAEALLNHLGEGNFIAESAGFEPGQLNPLVVEVMREIGIDISGNKTKSVFDFFKQGRNYHFVITVCDESSAEACPIFPGIAKRIHWSFKDPSQIKGTQDQKLAEIRIIRDEINKQLQKFITSDEVKSL